MLKQIWPSDTSVFSLWNVFGTFSHLSFQPWTKKGNHDADIWPLQQNITKSLRCKYENMIIQFESFKLAKLSTIYCRTLYWVWFRQNLIFGGPLTLKYSPAIFWYLVPSVDASTDFSAILIFKSWSSMQKATFEQKSSIISFWWFYCRGHYLPAGNFD